jgi:hypothetical protein
MHLVNRKLFPKARLQSVYAEADRQLCAGQAAASAMLLGMTRSWWRRWFTDSTPEPNAACPICGAPVVAAQDFYASSAFGAIGSRRTREELVAACHEHGHAPYNEATLRYLRDKAAD